MAARDGAPSLRAREQQKTRSGGLGKGGGGLVNARAAGRGWVRGGGLAGGGVGGVRVNCGGDGERPPRFPSSARCIAARREGRHGSRLGRAVTEPGRDGCDHQAGDGRAATQHGRDVGGGGM